MAAAAAGIAVCTSAAPAEAFKADVTRTTGGVPHIEAATLGDGAFGVGYSAAEDNICTLADVYLTGDAERAKFLGVGAGNANLNSDFFWKSIIDDGTVEDILDKPFPEGPSQDARAMARGYVAGYNKYLADKGGAAGITDPRCAGQPWVRPLTTIDAWKLALNLSMRASSNQNIGGIVSAAPPAVPRGIVGQVARTSSSQEWTDQDVKDALAGTIFDTTADPKLGSNAIGVGGDNTRTGGGVVLGNPHFPWNGNERFWEFQLKVPGEVDVVGASLMGSPVVNIGHNKHVAWSHTVSTGRRFTLHKLQLVPGQPTKYVFEGQEESMRKQTVAVDVLNGPAQTHDFYFSRFGRVANFTAVQASWNTSNAYAFDDANGDNLRVFDQWLAMDKARSAQELMDAQKRIGGIPWVNTLGADDKGNSFYTDYSVTPHVTNAQLAPAECGVGTATVPAATVRGNRVYLLDGTKAKCSLKSDDDSVVPGIFGASQLPALKNRTYVQNSNDSHWLTNPTTPLTGFPEVVGPEVGPAALRTRLGIDIINDRLAGTDGQPGNKFTLETLKGAWLQFRSLGAELTLPGLRNICNTAPGGVINGVNVSAACPVLDNYDGTGKRDSKGGWLFARFWAGTQNTNASFFTTPYNVGDPVGTPNTLNESFASTRNALAAAVKDLSDRGIPLDASIGEVQKFTRNGQAIGIPGCNSGCYPVISSSYTGTTSKISEVASGNSFVMFAEMDPDTGPRAEALLTYSQSEDSTSPYYKDQTELYSNSQWLVLPYTDGEIASAFLNTRTLDDGAAPEGQGPAGPTGPTGPIGTTGPQGPIGTTGPIGPQGDQGPIGTTGPVGPQGNQGPIGSTGPVGPQGNQGSQGNQGLPGADGKDGKDGAAGPAGPAGSQGPAGPAGQNGASGSSGSQG